MSQLVSVHDSIGDGWHRAKDGAIGDKNVDGMNVDSCLGK
jgi:hypothetical protein